MYNQLLALAPTIETTLQTLQDKKQAFIDLLPQIMTILGNPRDVIFDALVTLNESFIKLKIALIVATPVSTIFTLFASLLDVLVLRIT